MRISPANLLIVGFVMVVLGFVLPFLMIVRVIPTTYFLSFLSYVVSFGGVIMGVIGAAWYSRLHRG